MLKLLGSLCILGAGGAAGAAQLRRMRRELTVLRELTGALDVLEGEIRFSRTALPLALRRAGRGRDVCGFFEAAAAALMEGESPAAAFRRCAAALPIQTTDRMALAEAGKGLLGDETEACGALRAAGKMLEQSLREKSGRQAETEKRTAAVWLSGAALLILVLL